MSPTSRRRRPHRGGRRGFEPRAVIVARQDRVWQLSLQGRTQREIATSEGISQAAVSKILARTEEQTYSAMVRQRDRTLARIVAQQQRVVREGFEGYAQSQRARTRKHERRIESAGRPGITRVTNVTIEEGAADPRHLQVVSTALSQLQRFFQGLPSTALEGPTLNLAALTPEEWHDYQRLYARLTGASGGPSSTNDGEEGAS